MFYVNNSVHGSSAARGGVVVVGVVRVVTQLKIATVTST